MLVLVDGFGSIGKKYVQMLGKLCDVHIYDPYINPSHCSLPSNCLFINELYSKSITYDYVFICSPTGTHVDKLDFYQSVAKKILVEKPLAISLNEVNKCQQMIECNSKLSGKTVVSSPRRFSTSLGILSGEYTDILKDAKSGFFRFSHSLRRMRGPKWRKNYIFDPDLMYRYPLAFDCIHELDIASSIFGQIESLEIITSKTHISNTVDLHYSLHVNHHGGSKTFHTFDYNSDVKIREMNIVAECGTFSSFEIGKDSTNVLISVCYDHDDGISASHSNRQFVANDTSFEAQFNHFIDSSFDIKHFSTLDDSLSISKALVNA